MFKIAIVIIALLGASVYGELVFQGNVSMSGTSTDWQYRRTSLGYASLLGLGWFTSAEAERSGVHFSGDLIIGGIKGGLFSYPTQFLAYYTSNISVTVDQSIFSVDASATSNFIGTSYLEIVEKDPSGDVVATLNLLGGTGIKWTLSDSSTTDTLKYATFTGTSTTTAGTYSVKFTVMVSDVTGVVSLAGAVVTPKVLETVVEIDNWPYQQSSNTLTLVTVTATGAGSAERNIIASGSGTNQVYFQLNDTVLVSGTKHSVTISGSAAEVVDIRDSDLMALVNNKFSGSANVHMYNITFPAGAVTITYDPTLGSGATVSSQQSAATTTTVVPFFLVALLAFAAVVLV